MLFKNPQASHQYNYRRSIIPSRWAKHGSRDSYSCIYIRDRRLEIKVKVKEESARERIKPKKLELEK